MLGTFHYWLVSFSLHLVEGRAVSLLRDKPPRTLFNALVGLSAGMQPDATRLRNPTHRSMASLQLVFLREPAGFCDARARAKRQPWRRWVSLGTCGVVFRVASHIESSAGACICQDGGATWACQFFLRGYIFLVFAWTRKGKAHFETAQVLLFEE